jgi:ATPase subunit of ABC transporter with duplicated ATPase domains
MNIAEESLKELKEDLDHFLKSDEERKKDDEKEKKKGEEKKKSQNINPFLALFGIFGLTKKDDKKKNKEIEKSEDIVPDNYIEKIVRAEAAKGAAGSLYTIYDVYKKAHGMASAPGAGFQREDGSKTGYPSLKRKIFKRI